MQLSEAFVAVRKTLSTTKSVYFSLFPFSSFFLPSFLTSLLACLLSCLLIFFSFLFSFLSYFLSVFLSFCHFLFLKGGLFVILRDCMIFLSPYLDVTRMSMSTVSFLAQVDSGIFCL